MAGIRQWIKNARDVSLMQSLLPAILAVVLAIGQTGFCWWMALLAVVGVASAHLSLNLADDYFDYKADMLSDRERVIRKGFRAMMVKYPYLTDGRETPRTLMRAILGFAAFALACGIPVFVVRLLSAGFFTPNGVWWIAAIVSVTAILGVFYSAPPLKLGYRGWGELVIGIIFGPLLIMGVYYASAGSINPPAVWISIPVGLFVVNILYTHSFVERESDAASNKMTFARLLRTDRACLAASFVFNFLPFLSVVVAVVLGYLHPLYLSVLLMLPRAIWLFCSLIGFTRGRTGVPEKPPFWLGRMIKWEPVREAGIDWFLMRWMTARNTLAGFCFLVIAVKVVLLSIN